MLLFFGRFNQFPVIVVIQNRISFPDVDFDVLVLR